MIKKITLLLLLMIILSCVEDEDSNKHLDIEDYYYNTSVFVGMDSILYLEQHRITRDVYGGQIAQALVSETQLKIINMQGQHISTIWTQNLDTEKKLIFMHSYSISFSKEAKKIFIGFLGSDQIDESWSYGIMICDLKGEVTSYFNDNDLSYKISEGQYGIYYIHSSPNGFYYTAGNKIKNTDGNIIKTIDKEILDWNSNGLLVRDTSINIETINLEGNNYKVYSHPKAKTWFGTDFNYSFLDNDSLIIQHWHDSSISQRIYTPYFPMDSDFNFNSSMISPDLKHIVHQGSGYLDIQLLNLSNGESHIIKEIPTVSYTYH